MMTIASQKIIAALFFMLAAYAASHGAAGAASPQPRPEAPMQPPPDPEAAIRAEFATLAAQNTVEAFELFIARHPDHALAEEARRRIAALRKASSE